MPEKLRLGSIKKTAVSYWSDEDECYVMESPLFSRCVAVGDSPYEAKSKFNEMLTSTYPHIQNENVSGYNKVGRPAKGNIEIHASVRPTTRSELKALCDDLDISVGEVIDFLLFYHSVKSKSESTLDAVPKEDQRTIKEIHANTIFISNELKALKKLLKAK